MLDGNLGNDLADRPGDVLRDGVLARKRTRLRGGAGDLGREALEYWAELRELDGSDGGARGLDEDALFLANLDTLLLADLDLDDLDDDLAHFLVIYDLADLDRLLLRHEHAVRLADDLADDLALLGRAILNLLDRLDVDAALLEDEAAFRGFNKADWSRLLGGRQGEQAQGGEKEQLHDWGWG